MRAQPCLPEDIFDVNRHKEYTLIATDLLESVLTDTRLNAQTTKLWQILFNKARYNPNLEIKISYSYLGKKLGKSTRTIARYVDLLQKSGYLVVTHNFDNKGGQRPSTISIRVPEFSIEHIKKRKDRPTKNRLESNESLILENKKTNLTTYEVEITQQTSLETTLKQERDEPFNVLCETFNDGLIKSDITQTSTAPKDIEIYAQCVATEIITQPLDNIDREGHDNNVLHKDNNKKDINKNNNNTVVAFLQDEELKSKRINLEQEIKLLQDQHIEETKQLTTIKDKALLYDQIKKTNELDTALRLAKMSLERVNKEINENDLSNKTEATLNNNSNFILHKQGERPLTQFTFKRLVRSLKKYGYQGNILNSLINEIIFEVRFGSLIKCNKTQTPLSLDNAINIGLKLIRENRWSTPTLLKKYANTNFYQA